jgi:hypothetical protein
MLASVIKVKNTILVEDNINDKVDFITWSRNQYHYFGLCLTLLIVTITTYVMDNNLRTKKSADNKCYGKPYRYVDPIQGLIPVHLI